MEQETHKIENPKNKPLVALGFTMFGFLLAIGVVVYLITGSILLLFIESGIALPGIILFWFRLFRDMPRFVVIEKNGISLVYSNNRTRQVPFDSMESIITEYRHARSPSERRIRSGGLRIKGKHSPILISAKIAAEIKKRYEESVGTPLPEMPLEY